MVEQTLRLARITKHLPYVRGLGVLRQVYERVLPKRDLNLRVDDFDGDLVMEVDVREIIGINVWHRPKFFEKHERDLFCSAILPGSVVLDVGANVGIYTMLAAKRGARVFAIEADPHNVEQLQRHIRLNGFEDRVKVVHMAATDKAEIVRVFRCHGNSGHSNIFEGVDGVAVDARTIDSLDLPPIDICKMDIEGAEMMALSGMQQTIRRSPKMKLLVEYAQSLRHTEGMLEFICSRFDEVYAIRKPPFRHKGPLRATDKLPSFCNLWAIRN